MAAFWWKKRWQNFVIMDDKERISRLIMTLMYLKRILVITKGMSDQDDVKKELDRMANTIEMVINKNTDDIKLNL